MKNILITGGNGFVASNIYEKIIKKHNVFLTNRRTLDILDSKKVNDFFNKNKIDVVIHTAVCGGSRFKDDDFSVLTDNINMFNNLVKNKNKYGSLIHFGSGAEFDRRTDIVFAKENQKAFPVDYYGLSKKIIKTEIDKLENFYNLRLFGCFGKGEEETRFIKSAIDNIKNKNPIIIHQNRYMDYFYIEDLCSVIEYYIEQIDKKILPKDINLCYNERRSLLDIAVMINEITGKPHGNIVIENKGYYTEYTGNGNKLSELGLTLFGMKKGLERCINV